jgi:hypothetical protein
MISSISRAIRSTGEMGGILEQREETVRWVERQPNQSALVDYQNTENSA